METVKSGNGVKVANRFEIVSKIEGKNYWSDYRISKMKSADLLKYWDYKAEGLTLDVAKKELYGAIATRTQVQQTKPRPVSKKSTGKYLGLVEEKRNSIDSFLKTCEKLEPAQRAYRYNYGNYKYQHRTFLLTNSAPYPITISVQWSEDHDWNYYAKSYGKPKSTYSDRVVVFKTIGKLGKVVEIYRYELSTFSGNFIEKAIATFYGIEKIKVSKELKPVQLSDFFSLCELKAINGYRLFERRIGEMVWDFAILDTKTGTNYHANCFDDLVTGLRNKMQAKADIEFETITKATGFALGFCETGMRNFCADNGVDFDGVYARRELRNIAVANRAVNCKKYKNELKQIGIIINCK